MIKTKSLKTATLKNDYERMVPEFHKNSIIYGEHLVRYLSAQKIVKGKTVLDIASGSGYGTHSLAKTAKFVYGVDVSKEAVEYAKSKFSAKNIKYLMSDGVKIPLEDKSVDVVVSFETIEHIENYEAFMAEVKRVLKSDGLFLLSTPNDTEFAEGNHFHIHEFEHKELQRLVAKYFTHTAEYFQADWLYSGIHAKEEITNEGEVNIKLINTAPLKMDQVLYFFMLCANRDIYETVDSFGSVSQHWSERKNQDKQQLTDQHIANIQHVSDDRLQYVRKLEGTILSQEKELLQLRKLANSIPGKIITKLKRR